jgi:transposase
MLYALALKTYLGFSSRRVHSDLKLSKDLGYVDNAFHFNTLLKYLENSDLKVLLKELIETAALPLKQVELDFAADSTGFGTSRFVRWMDIRLRKDSVKRTFRKCHCMYGVQTNIVTSIEITSGYTHDSTQFKKLVKSTAHDWTMREISADMGYLSRKNMELVSKFGAIPYIPFKSNTTGKAGGCQIWRRMYEYFSEHKNEFMKHYHKRSNAESGFFMIKERFGNNVRCKKETSQDNEILLKVLCHNICVLVQEIFLNDINVDFRKCAEIYSAHN